MGGAFAKQTRRAGASPLEQPGAVATGAFHEGTQFDRNGPADHRGPQLGPRRPVQVDVVAAIFGGQLGPRSTASDIVYIIVGLAALYGFYLFRPLLLGTEDTDRDTVRRDTLGNMRR